MNRFGKLSARKALNPIFSNFLQRSAMSFINRKLNSCHGFQFDKNDIAKNPVVGQFGKATYKT